MLRLGAVSASLLFIAALWSGTALADNTQLEACIASAAAYRQQDPLLLKAIALQESGMNPAAVNRSNKNGTVDHGAFQINSSWLPKLKRHGITERQLYDPCTAAYVASWILAQEIHRHGSTWRAVGAYNSPTEANQKIYAQKIRQRYTSLLNNKGR